MSTAEKQYGLIEVKTGKKLTLSDVFNNDSESDGEKGNCMKKFNVAKDDKSLKRQTKLDMQRALQEDPTVYQYDEVYDDMTQKKQELELVKTNPERKPKYIENLMKTAEKRKKENERRLERQIQKEREAEGDMFKDKEEFITSSYKQKLEEFKKAEEEEKKMEYIESIMDVSKQQDLGGFYRHLYKETVGGENAESSDQLEGIESKSEVAKITESHNEGPTKPHQERNYRKRNSTESLDGEEKRLKGSSSSSSDSDSTTDSSSTSSSSDDEKAEGQEVSQTEVKAVQETVTSEKNDKVELTSKTKKTKEETKSEQKEESSKNGSRTSKSDDRDRRDRNYRSYGYDSNRQSSNRSQSRRDIRSYSDRDRDRDRERRDGKMRERRDERNSTSRRRRSRTPESRRPRNKSKERSPDRGRSRRRENEQGRDDRETRNVEAKKDSKEQKKDDPSKKIVTEEKKEVEENIPKPSIWEKRTVGAAFEAAVERYKERKAARGS